MRGGINQHILPWRSKITHYNVPKRWRKKNVGWKYLENLSQKDEHEELEPTIVAGGEENSEEWLEFFG